MPKGMIHGDPPAPVVTDCAWMYVIGVVVVDDVVIDANSNIDSHIQTLSIAHVLFILIGIMMMMIMMKYVGVVDT